MSFDLRNVSKELFEQLKEEYAEEFKDSSRKRENFTLQEIKEVHNPTAIKFLERYGIIEFMQKQNEAKHAKNKIFLGGGSLRRLFEYNTYNNNFDYDFYFSKQYVRGDFDNNKQEFFNHLVMQGFNFFRGPQDNSDFMTLTSPEGRPVQILGFTKFETVYDLIDQFDFTVCQFAFDGNKIYTYTDSVEDVYNKILKISGCKANPRIFARLQKYIDKYGFKIEDEKRFYKKYDLIHKIQMLHDILVMNMQKDGAYEHYSIFKKDREQMMSEIQNIFLNKEKHDKNGTLDYADLLSDIM